MKQIKQEEISRKAQALYYRLRAEGLSHSEAMNAVIAVIYRLVMNPEEDSE